MRDPGAGFSAYGKAVQVSGGWSNGAKSNAAGALTSQKIAIAKRRFKDQRRIFLAGRLPCYFFGQVPTMPHDASAHAERLHQALERDQVIDVDHVASSEDQR